MLDLSQHSDETLYEAIHDLRTLTTIPENSPMRKIYHDEFPDQKFNILPAITMGVEIGAELGKRLILQKSA